MYFHNKWPLQGNAASYFCRVDTADGLAYDDRGRRLPPPQEAIDGLLIGISSGAVEVASPGGLSLVNLYRLRSTWKWGE